MLTLVTRAARLMALIGGFVLTALVILTCVSVLGRGLNTLGHSDLLEGLAPALAAWLAGTGIGPVTGDYELVEAGIAFAVFAFLPICQLYACHATVDVFTAMMPGRVNSYLAAFWEVVLALVIVVIGWRLFLGFTEKLDNGQTTFLLQFPVWWAYGASFGAALVAGLVGLYCAGARVAEALTGRPYLPGGAGADH
jgi:TRAP-type C4-dicarboxylate transport system permease small subunit